MPSGGVREAMSRVGKEEANQELGLAVNNVIVAKHAQGENAPDAVRELAELLSRNPELIARLIEDQRVL